MKENISGTKSVIMKITEEIIKEGGTSSVSMRDLGKRAGLSRSAVYRHFYSKEHLFAEIVTQHFLLLNDSFESLKNREDSVQDKIFQMLIFFYEFGVSNNEIYKLMFGYEWAADKYPSLTAAAYETFEIFSSIIHDAQNEKALRKLPHNELAAIIYSYIHGLIQLHQAGHSEDEKGLGNAESLISSFIGLIKTAG